MLQPLQIKSVIAKEGLRGYIYIEAFKQTHVKQIIEGVGNLFIGRWQQMVCQTDCFLRYLFVFALCRTLLISAYTLCSLQKAKVAQ